MEGKFRCTVRECTFTVDIDNWPEYKDGTPQHYSVYAELSPEGYLPDWLQAIRKHHRGTSKNVSKFFADVEIPGHATGEIDFGNVHGVKKVLYGRNNVYFETRGLASLDDK